MLGQSVKHVVEEADASADPDGLMCRGLAGMGFRMLVGQAIIFGVIW